MLVKVFWIYIHRRSCSVDSLRYFCVALVSVWFCPHGAGSVPSSFIFWKFVKDWSEFLCKCVVKFSSEAIWAWALLCEGFFVYEFLYFFQLCWHFLVLESALVVLSLKHLIISSQVSNQCCSQYSWIILFISARLAVKPSFILDVINLSLLYIKLKPCQFCSSFQGASFWFCWFSLELSFCLFLLFLFWSLVFPSFCSGGSHSLYPACPEVRLGQWHEIYLF